MAWVPLRFVLPAAAALTLGCAPVTRPVASPPSSPSRGDAQVRVVCRACSPELLDAKRAGIERAMRLFVAYAGADVVSDVAPVTFHLDGDAFCGTAEDMQRRTGFVTGFTALDRDGKASCCLFDREKKNRALPFTPANARTLADQLLALHEAAHAWMTGRVADGRVQEPLARMISLVLSGSIPDPCTGFRMTDSPDRLIADLCDAGMTTGHLPEVLARVAIEASTKRRALDDVELAVLVSGVIGADAFVAFRAAGLLPAGRNAP